MAPSTSPTSSARTMPKAWEPQPIASPCATRSVTPNSRRIRGAAILPKMPVTEMTAMVMPPAPPSSSASGIPTAPVTDLGSRVTKSAWDSRNASATASTVRAFTATPVRIPAAMASGCCRSFWICR